MMIVELSQDEITDVSGGGYLWTIITDTGWFVVTYAVSLGLAALIPKGPKEVTFNEQIIDVPYLKQVMGGLDYVFKSFAAACSLKERHKRAFKFFVGACVLQAVIGCMGL